MTSTIARIFVLGGLALSLSMTRPAGAEPEKLEVRRSPTGVTSDEGTRRADVRFAWL